jgi:hypothetical protein
MMACVVSGLHAHARHLCVGGSVCVGSCDCVCVPQTACNHVNADSNVTCAGGATVYQSTFDLLAEAAVLGGCNPQW